MAPAAVAESAVPDSLPGRRRSASRVRVYDGPLAWPAASGSSAPHGLLLVAPGSGDPDSRDAAVGLAQRLRETAQGHAVGLAFLAYASPSVAATFRALVALGATRITLVPLALHGDAGSARGLARQARRLARECDVDQVSVAPGIEHCIDLPSTLVATASAAVALEPDDRVYETDFDVERAQRVRPRFWERHAFICTSSWCQERGAGDVYAAVRDTLRAAEANPSVRVHLTRTSCLRLCGAGPNVVVYPDATWYSGLDAAGLTRVIQEHLVGGRVVDDLACTPPEE